MKSKYGLTAALLFCFSLAAASAQTSPSTAELQDDFECLKKNAYDINTAGYLAEKIHEAVKGGTTTWKDLGFTAAEVDSAFRSSRVKDLRLDFKCLSERGYARNTAQAIVNGVRLAIKNGTATWADLGFSDAQLQAAYLNSRMHFELHRD